MLLIELRQSALRPKPNELNHDKFYNIPSVIFTMSNSYIKNHQKDLMPDRYNL